MQTAHTHNVKFRRAGWLTVTAILLAGLAFALAPMQPVAAARQALVARLKGATTVEKKAASVASVAAAVKRSAPGAVITGTTTPAQGDVCTPTTTVTEGDLAPGGIAFFTVTSGPGSVTVDHVNAGTGLQSLTVVGTPINAVVTIPAFTPGTFNPVTVGFTPINPALAVDFTLRAASTFNSIFIRVRCAGAEVCTPGTTVTEGDLQPGGPAFFTVTSGPGSVTVDHVNAGTGLQSLTVVGTPINAVVTIPPFTPGTFAPVVVTFTSINPNLAVDFTLRAASTFNAIFIRVQCGTPPTPCMITCPANLTVSNDPNQCGAVVTYPAPTTTGTCGTVTCSPASGSLFLKGTTTVTCTATGAPQPTCTFTVTVNDTQPPAITCPANIAVGTTGASAVVSFNTTASDNCPGVVVVCTPPSGSSFNVGTTTVTCTATDASGNTATCTFRVNVLRVSYSLSDPLACTGPGNAVTGTFSITNSGGAAVAVAASVTLPAGLVGVPGSCVTNTGTCSVVNPSLVSFTGTVGAGQTATVSYTAQVGDLVAPGTILCSLLQVTFAGSPPFTVQACITATCPAVGPGSLFPAASEMSDQKAGSVLIYNIYTSGATSGNTQNTRINITNVHPVLPSFVHLFFVAEGCAVADSYICLTGNQTASFLASDLDPGTTGYVVAIASDALGCPTNFNYLIGDEYVKFTSGHAANLGAEAFAALPGGLPFCNANSVTATINFDGISYNRAPRTVALSNVGSRADGNDTLLILNRIGGNLGTGASTLGPIFGIFYDDAENSLSFSFSGNCQLRNSLSNNFPRITPRFETFVPAGRTGWLKLFSQSDIGITGAAINFNPNAASSAGAFNQGHNLHTLTTTSAASYVIPIFPAGC